MKRISMIVGFVALLSLAACGGSSDGGESGGGGRELSGGYEPQFAPGTPRYEMALSDRRLDFLPDHKVEITNTYGKKTWRYSIRGKQIIMKHANGDVRKHYSIASGGCLLLKCGQTHSRASILPCIAPFPYRFSKDGEPPHDNEYKPIGAPSRIGKSASKSNGKVSNLYRYCGDRTFSGWLRRRRRSAGL
ncbi:MAG: hypothetical protein GXP06_03420 [Alphaproteobacteria bacterium]|nr:hypothetical protein [Alphaproteobacteria bacterium]